MQQVNRRLLQGNDPNQVYTVHNPLKCIDNSQRGGAETLAKKDCTLGVRYHKIRLNQALRHIATLTIEIAEA